MIVLAYIFIATAFIVAVIFVHEYIKFHFKVKYLEVESVYKAGLIDTAFCDMQWLSEETIRKTNDYFQDVFKTMTGES